MLTAFDRRVAETEIALLDRAIAAKTRYLTRVDLEPARREAVRGMRGALMDERTTLQLRLAQEGLTTPSAWLRQLRERYDESGEPGVGECPFCGRDAETFGDEGCTRCREVA